MYSFFHPESDNIIFISSGMAITCAFRPFIRRSTPGKVDLLQKNPSYDFLNIFISKLDDPHHCYISCSIQLRSIILDI